MRKNSAHTEPRRSILYTFQCTACGCVEHRRTPALPEGWETEQIGDDIFAYCPDDAIDLPQGAVQ